MRPARLSYYAQHPAGLGGLVSEAVIEQFPGATIRFQDDSSLLFDTRAAPVDVGSVSYVTSAFLVVGEAARRRLDGGLARGLTTDLGRFRSVVRPKRSAAFRLMSSTDGELVAIPRDARAHLERSIAEAFGGRPEPRGGSDEYWLVSRRGHDRTFLAYRLSRANRPAASAKGSLRPELSRLLVRASRPTPQDRFLDPFAGSGALVAARLELPARQIIYSDIEPVAQRPRGNLTLLDDDALTLPSVASGSISAIVTDPPWGEHEQSGIGDPEFAHAMCRAMARVLDPAGGRFVLLVSRRTSDVVARTAGHAGLAVRTRYDILVNGHPASVLVG